MSFGSPGYGDGTQRDAYGYNEERVLNTLRQLVSSYEDFTQAFTTTMQQKFIGEMSKVWHSETAVTFFTRYQNVINDLLVEACKEYEGAYNGVQWAAHCYAQNSGADFTGIDFGHYPSQVHIDGEVTPHDESGNRLIIKDSALNILGELTLVENMATAALDSAIGTVSSCGFLGREQSALVSRFERIKSTLVHLISEMKVDGEKSIREAVNAFETASISATNKFNE